VELLQLEHVGVRYGKQRVLVDVCCKLRPGEIGVVSGRNGSGKSTLLRAIAGLESTYHGTISIRNASQHGKSVHARQQEGVGSLLQGGRVFPSLNVEEHFTLASERRPADAPHFKLGDVFPHLLTLRTRSARVLSGGERKMLAIELLLAEHPHILLLDEPTAALGSEQLLPAARAIREHVDACQGCALIVEHRQPELFGAGPRYHLEDGKLSNLAGVQT